MGLSPLRPYPRPHETLCSALFPALRVVTAAPACHVLSAAPEGPAPLLVLTPPLALWDASCAAKVLRVQKGPALEFMLFCCCLEILSNF